MYSTANESRQSDNARNISAELQHFLTDQSDSNVISQDYIFAFKKKEDANTNANEKARTKEQNTKIVPSEKPENINAQQHASYYKRKFEAKHKHQDMNVEKETSFPDAPRTNEFGLTHFFGWNKFSIDLTQDPVDKAKRNVDDVPKELLDC